jgi:glycosyltransferase involved in cell wall biosynthesis
MAKPAAGPAGWSKLALVLWSQGKAGTLVEHAATHPSGSEAAVSAVQGFYAASVKHHEIETALRLGDYLVEQRPGDAALARRIQLLRDSAADEAADRQADAALAKADAVPSKSVAAPLGRTGAKAEQPVPPKVSQPAPGQRRIGSDWLREEREAERREQHRSRDLSEPEGAGDVPAGIADDAPISRPAVTQAEPEQAEPEKAKPEPAERAAKKETSKRKSKRDDLAGGDAFARLAILRKRVSGSPRGEGRRLLNQAFVGILDDIRAAGGTGLGKRTDDLQAIVAVLSDQTPVLARFYFDIGETRRALGLYLNAPARFLRTSEWLDAARLAHDQKDRALMLEFSRRAAMLNGLKSASQAALLLAGVGEFEAATALLREIGRPEGSLATTGAMMRLLMDLGRSREAFDLGLKAASECWPPEALEAPQQNNLISLMRQTSRAGRHAGIDVKTVEAWEAMRAAPTSALAHWCDAMVWLALDDRKRAVAALEAAAAAPGPADGINIDIAGETALVHVRYRRFGDALRTNYPLSADATGEDFYANRLRLVQEVAAFTGQCELYPECLVDVIFEEIVPSPLRYDPNPGHVVTVSGSFAQGGSERQTVNVIEAFVADGRLAGQTVLVRSTDNEDGFFKPVLDRLPLETRVYGQSWTEQSDIAEYLPELTDRPRLSRAIALLPHNIREDVVRLCRQLWDTKPETVHVRQDLHGAALACAIAGVPTFFIHRGSLSRDQWDHTPLHAEHVLRPMRHIYRKLLEHTHFFIVNNSNPGLDTDKAWLAWPDAGRFHVVHNAIDFDRLDAELPPDADVRRQLGIPEDAPVIGGVFRMAAVKRPLLWIETARLVLDRLPAAHFIIAGDFGELGEEVRAYAREHGFAERLHLPGAVTPVAPWYRAMDVLLLTSDREGLPNVNIEAQHFGVPVVSAEVGGAPETIEPDVTGFLVAPHAGAAAFADQVVRALTDTAWREHATRRGPEFVHAAFGTGQALDRLFMLYRLAPRH